MFVLRAEGRLAVGTTLPPLAVKGLDGSPATISYLDNDRPTVLYVFKPECGWCTRNLPNLKALARSVSGEYRFVMLSLTDGALRDYVARNELGAIPVYGGLAEAERITYKLGGTPQTIVVSKEGKVLKSWMGAYTGAAAEEIEEYFDTRLPGLAEQAATERAGGN